MSRETTTRSAEGTPVLPEAHEESIYVASQWQLMWWRFRKHKAAMFSTLVILALLGIAAFPEFLAPGNPSAYSAAYGYAPPQRLRFADESGFGLRPFVYALGGERDPDTLEIIFEEDRSRRHYLRFFVRGEPYEIWGLFPSNLHLVGLEDPDAPLFLLGADRTGRDILSRTIHGTRISISIGLVGVALSLSLGIVLGGVSGYYGGTVDLVIQRLIEFIRSVPSIPLWMALSAALPAHWSSLRVYFGITIILSLIGWTSLGRVVRGRFLSLRSEDFVMAAKLSGASEMRIILRHMVPSFYSHIIASITLSIPSMILSETSLSFLGLGLRPPIISWGVLLKEAQNVRTVVIAPWLFLPGLMVVIAVLAFNFVGDGLRDAADPYSR